MNVGVGVSVGTGAEVATGVGDSVVIGTGAGGNKVAMISRVGVIRIY